jgi:hypothetical protein
VEHLSHHLLMSVFLVQLICAEAVLSQLWLSRNVVVRLEVVIFSRSVMGVLLDAKGIVLSYTVRVALQFD